VADGGGLLIFPGDKVTPDAYNKQFFTVPGALGQSLTAAQLGPAVGDPDKGETAEGLANFDLNHPALAVFDNPDPKIRHFATVRVYKHFPLALPPKKGNAWPLARFSSGGPALVESRYGDGRLVLAAFPAHPRWTNLPTKPDFVPLVLRLAGYVQHRAEVEAPAVVPAAGVAELSVRRGWEPAEAEVKGPVGQPVKVALERVGGRLVGAFDQTAAPGYYTAEVKSTRQGANKSETVGFAVNLDPLESDLTPLGEADMKKLLPSAKLTFLDVSTQEKQFEKKDEGGKQEVWRPLWFVVLLTILALEFLMATTGGRRKDTEEAPGLEGVGGAR
jgi:hypothetical protein